MSLASTTVIDFEIAWLEQSSEISRLCCVKHLLKLVRRRCCRVGRFSFDIEKTAPDPARASSNLRANPGDGPERGRKIRKRLRYQDTEVDMSVHAAAKRN